MKKYFMAIAVVAMSATFSFAQTPAVKAAEATKVPVTKAATATKAVVTKTADAAIAPAQDAPKVVAKAKVAAKATKATKSTKAKGKKGKRATTQEVEVKSDVSKGGRPVGSKTKAKEKTVNVGFNALILLLKRVLPLLIQMGISPCYLVGDGLQDFANC